MTNPRFIALVLASSIPLCASLASAAKVTDSVAVIEPTTAAGSIIDETKGDATRPPSDLWAARPLAILGHVQTIGPMGVFGLSAEYSFNPYFAAGLGVGTNGDTQGAAMARFRLPLDDHFGAGVGLGASYGKPFTLDFCVWAPCKIEPKPAVLSGDAELYVEGRTTSGFTARLYGGVHQQLSWERRMNGYFGIAGGWSF